jgi:hypothetical protein
MAQDYIDATGAALVPARQRLVRSRQARRVLAIIVGLPKIPLDSDPDDKLRC